MVTTNLTYMSVFLSATCKPDCLNGGTCVNDRCVCAPGYLGAICNIGEDTLPPPSSPRIVGGVSFLGRGGSAF